MDPKAIRNEEARRWVLDVEAFVGERLGTKPSLPEWDIYGWGPSNAEEVEAAIVAEAERADELATQFEVWRAETEAMAEALRQRFNKGKNWNLASYKAKFERELLDLLGSGPIK